MKLKDACSCKKSYDKLRQCIKKQRHYFAHKGLNTQSYGFSSSHVWMGELDHKEGWTLKNWCFELWCWTRLLKVLWISRRSNQSILKKISPEYSLERLMLKLKLQYFGHLMRRADSLEETLMLGKIKGRRRGRQMALLIQWTWVWASSGRWWSTRKPIILLSMKSQKIRCYWATEQQ